MRHRRFAISGLLCLFSACAPALVAPEDDREYHQIGDLEFSATVEQDIESVYGLIDIMNPTRSPVLVEYSSGCAVAYLVHQDGRTTPSWESSRWWTGLQGSCPSEPMRMEIPAATLGRIMAPAVDPGIVLGDSLPAGSYQVAMRIRLLQPLDTTLILRAGPVQLDP